MDDDQIASELRQTLAAFNTWLLTAQDHGLTVDVATDAEVIGVDVLPTRVVTGPPRQIVTVRVFKKVFL